MAKRGQGEGTISRRPDGSWCGRITVGRDENGKQKRKAFYGKTRKEVQEKMTEALDSLNKGYYIEPSKILYKDWVSIWLKEYKKSTLRPSTYESYERAARLYINPELGDCTLSELRNDMIQRFVNKMTSDGYFCKTVSIAHLVLHGSLEQACANDLIVKNPAKHIKLPKPVEAQVEVMTSEEQERFILAAQNEPKGELYILILATGLRIGEALALTWKDLDFDKGVVHVNKTITYAKDPDEKDAKRLIDVGPPKTKASKRSIPLLPDIVDMMKRYKTLYSEVERPLETYHLKHFDFVFTSMYGTVWNKAVINEKFRRILKSANINKKLHIHCLRHTFATRGLENGIPLRVMQDLLGHTSIQMTADLYTHVLPETKTDEIKKLEGTIKLLNNDAGQMGGTT